MAYDAQGNYIPDQMSMTGPQGVTGSGFFNTQLPQQPTGAMPATGVNIPGAPSSGLSTGQVAGGLALGGLLGGNLDINNLLQAAGNYYTGQQAIEGAYNVGQTGLTMAEQMGQRAAESSQFKPFTVTSSLARAGTTPQGGYTLELSPQQQALQEQLLGQAQGLFGQVGQDPAAQQAALYEQIRATQRPEEERQQALLQERLFAGGRGGLQTAQYGGSPEQFAYEKARQEAMAGASLSARNQALAEQRQALASATGLLGAGYNPQQQALAALGYGTDIANIAGTGQRTGATLQAQLGQTGLESYLQAAKIASDREFAQKQLLSQAAQGLLGGISQPSGGGFDYAGILSSLFKPSASGEPTYASSGWLGGDGEFNYGDLSNLFGSPSQGFTPNYTSDSWLGGEGFLSSLASGGYGYGAGGYGYGSTAPATSPGEIDISNYLTL